MINCSGCPILNNSEYHDECNLEYNIEWNGLTYISDNCGLNHIEYDGKDDIEIFKPIEI